MPSILLIFVVRASNVPWFWPVVGAGAGVYLFYHGFHLLQRKRLIMNTPCSKVRSAAMGLVEISGQATGPYTLTAPITGVPCYYYRTLVWQWKHQGRNSSWVKEADECMHVPFYLDDSTGRLLVNPQAAELDIHRDFHDEFSPSVFSSHMEMPANIAGFLTAHGVDSGARVKIEEYCIKPKNALFVLGTLASNPGIEVSPIPVRTTPTSDRTFALGFGGMSFRPSLMVSQETTVHLFNGNAQPEATTTSKRVILDPVEQTKIAAALTRAGITSPAAWSAAGISQVQTATPVAGNSGSAAAAVALEQFDLHPHTVLMKGSRSPAFFISWRSQREVVQSLAWKSALMIWGGPALTIISFYLLAAMFGWF